MKITTIARYIPYALGAVVLAATLFTAGCHASAEYRGEEVNEQELAVKYQADIRALQLKADNLGMVYESQVAEIRAEEADINDAANLALAEIEQEKVLLSEVLSLGLNTALTVASGGTLNTGETIAPGAAGAVYGDNGTAFAKQTDDKNITGDAVGEGIHLVANENNDWIAENQSVGTAIAGSFSEVEA